MSDTRLSQQVVFKCSDNNADAESILELQRWMVQNKLPDRCQMFAKSAEHRKDPLPTNFFLQFQGGVRILKDTCNLPDLAVEYFVGSFCTQTEATMANQH